MSFTTLLGKYIYKKSKSSLSHLCLLLSAIIPPDPSHIPSPFMVTQLSLKKARRLAHKMQLFDDGPLQAAHTPEQGLQPVLLVPSLNDPDGHTFPSDVLLGSGSHLVLSVVSWVKPDWQVMQFPE